MKIQLFTFKSLLLSSFIGVAVFLTMTSEKYQESRINIHEHPNDSHSHSEVSIPKQSFMEIIFSSR